MGCQMLYAQNINTESIFKMQIFMDSSPYIYKENQNVKRNDSIYSLFSDTYELKLNALRTNHYYHYFDNFEFLELLIYDTNKGKFTDNVITRKEISNDIKPYSIGAGKGNRYVLAVNVKNGKSYRVVGFNGNDFLELIRDFFEIYNFSATKRIESKQFIKNYEVDSLDLKCLFHGLISNNFDRTKFPCLTRVNDLIIIN
jgi:hypothetical protein